MGMDWPDEDLNKEKPAEEESTDSAYTRRKGMLKKYEEYEKRKRDIQLAKFLEKRFYPSLEEEGDEVEPSTYFQKWLKDVKKQLPLNDGGDKRVYAHPEDPRKVVAVPYEDVTDHELKKKFYENKILSLLLPDKIPNIHLVHHSPPAIIIDRVMGETMDEMNSAQKKQRDEIARRLNDLGVSTDEYFENFMVDGEDKVYYVDDLITESGWNKEKILAEIEKLPETKKNRCLTYLKRLELIEKYQKDTDVK